MAFTPAGGREYYTDAKKLGSTGGDCSPKCRGIFCGTNAVELMFRFASGNTLAFTPGNDTFIPFAPAGVSSASAADIYQLF